MKIALIAAMAANRVIGKNNQLAWRLPEDLQYFKRVTLGHHLIMGRKTWDSIGRPLPGRTTIVISRQADFSPAGALVAHSLEQALQLCQGQEQVFVVGGAQIYALALPLAQRLYLTELAIEVDGDAWFPEFDAAQWQRVSHDPHQGADFAYAFSVYERVSAP